MRLKEGSPQASRLFPVLPVQFERCLQFASVAPSHASIQMPLPLYFSVDTGPGPGMAFARSVTGAVLLGSLAADLFSEGFH